jgi:hypothetical protein
MIIFVLKEEAESRRIVYGIYRDSSYRSSMHTLEHVRHTMRGSVYLTERNLIGRWFLLRPETFDMFHAACLPYVRYFAICQHRITVCDKDVEPPLNTGALHLLDSISNESVPSIQVHTQEYLQRGRNSKRCIYTFCQLMKSGNSFCCDPCSVECYYLLPLTQCCQHDRTT